MTVSDRTLSNLAVFALSLTLLGAVVVLRPHAPADGGGAAVGSLPVAWATWTDQILIVLAGICTLCAFAAVLINIRQNRARARGMRCLRQLIQHVGSGDLHLRIPAEATAEYAELAAELQRMVARLSTALIEAERQALAQGAELARAERLSGIGFLAGRVAHEINNPLNIITGYAELSLRQTDRPLGPEALADLREALQIIRDEGFRCKSVTERLLLLARPCNRSREVIAMARLIEEVIAATGGAAQDRNCQVHASLEPGDDLEIWGCREELRQVLLHLVLNAINAVAADTGEVMLRCVRDGQEIEASVSDNGRGMAPELAARAFEPFFSDRRPSGEAGFGLCVAHAVIQGHGGRITAASEGPGKGSRFTLRLPIYKVSQVGDGKAA